jgi:hypothetical protein
MLISDAIRREHTVKPSPSRKVEQQPNLENQSSKGSDKEDSGRKEKTYL